MRRPRQSELAPVSIEIEQRTVSVRGPTSPLLLVYGFLVIILLGTLLLLMPFARTESESIPFSNQLVDALFTSTSAAAVTGLVVVETDVAWTRFGQSVIMALFFIGGLGFMTGAAFLLMTVGQRLGLRGQLLLRAGLGEVQLGAISSLVRKIVIFSITVQFAGLIALFLRWYVFGKLWSGITPGEALWQSAFHAVSAFNNAGFEILPDSRFGSQNLQPFISDVPVLLIVAGLVIVGGLSYFVLADLASRRNFGLLRVDTKLVLIGTVILLFVGLVVFLATEWERPETIGDSSLPDKLTNAFFHSTTARTAGFSTFDYDGISSSNATVTQSLMFIGGASASAAGGVKINTVMVIVLASIATLSGTRRVNAFGRQIPRVSVNRALVVGSVAVVTLITLFTTLVSVQPELEFRQALFEVVSAFGTVGLSTGITGELNSGGKILIAITMFLGRFGPLTLALFMAGRESVDSYRLASERVRIG